MQTIITSAPNDLFEAKTKIKTVKNSFLRRGWEKFKAFFANIFGKQTQYQRISMQVIAYESKLQSVVLKMTQLLCKNYDNSIVIEDDGNGAPIVKSSAT